MEHTPVDQITFMCTDCHTRVKVDVTGHEDAADAIKKVYEKLAELGWERVNYGMFNILSKVVCNKCKCNYSSRSKILMK